jgi:hypothetical protein
MQVSEAGHVGPHDGAEQNPWALVLGTLSMVARHDPRSAIADVAADVLLEVIEEFCPAWEGATWAVTYAQGIGYLFDLPAVASPEGNPAGAEAGRPVSQP